MLDCTYILQDDTRSLQYQGPQYAANRLSLKEMTKKFEKYKRKTKFLMACFKKLSVFLLPVVRGMGKMDLVDDSGCQIEILARHLTEGFDKSNK